MEREGVFAPETVDDVRERYETLDPAAQSVVREATRTMSFDTTEFDDRVSPDVIESAKQAMFAALLEVQIGSREEFDSWQEDVDAAVVELGHEAVDNAVWHAPPFADTVVVATFQNEREAAVDTLRRQAFGRLYAEILDDGDAD